MNIEEAIEILKNSKKLYLKEKIDSDILEEAIETLLTAYEKEKEKNKELNRLKGFEMLDIFNMGKQSSRQRIEFDYVEKDKIKAKIEEVSNGTYDAKIVLESLLEKE